MIRSPELRDLLQHRADELHWQGLSVRRIAAALGVPRSTVFDWLRRYA